MATDSKRYPTQEGEQALRDQAAEPVLARLRLDVERASPRVRPLVEHILHNLFDPGLDYERMRKALEIRDNNRTTRFRAELGSTPAAYLHESRMEVAATLLARTDLEVARIAVLVGYEQPVFTTSFKRWAGLTPSAYRKPLRRAGHAAPLLEPPPELHPAGWRRLHEGTLAVDDAVRLVEYVVARYPEVRRRLVEEVAAEVARTAEVVDRLEKLLAEIRGVG